MDLLLNYIDFHLIVVWLIQNLQHLANLKVLLEDQLSNTGVLRLWRTGAEAKQLEPHEDLEVDVRNLARQINGLSSIL